MMTVGDMVKGEQDYQRSLLRYLRPIGKFRDEPATILSQKEAARLHTVAKGQELPSG